MASDNNLIVITLAGIAIALFIYINYQLTRRKSNSSSDSNNEGAADEIDDQTLKPSSSPTPTPGEHYEVFLSFSVADTHRGFTDQLYKRLMDFGISVFKDNEKLHICETIGPELYSAIKASKISIPIISSNYASSKWCLNELVEILECKKTSGLRVLPIFYKVEPSDVRTQEGGFGRVFELYIKRHKFDSKLVRKWKKALAEVSCLKALESNKVADGREEELVEIVVRKVSNELRKAILDVPDIIVGVEDHAQEIMRMIEGKPQDEVKIIGISGTRGIGKTTLAKVIYKKLSDDFESWTFVPNIRETSSQHKGMERLQEQVISDITMDKPPRKISNVDEGIIDIKRCFKGRKVLLLLDDVENREQLNKLAAHPGWFEPQSIIIITSRNKEVTEGLESSVHYELSELDFDQSFELFCKHAFGEHGSPLGGLETIARSIVRSTGGLPLAIEVVGSSLFGKSKGTWKATLEKLKKIPNDTVQEKLRRSYDCLKPTERQIFLDIACLPIRKRLQDAIYMWDDCDFYPREGIQVLISLSLIKIKDNNQLIMHDQLRNVGREIDRCESIHELGKRLWISEEALEVIHNKQGAQMVQALHLDCEEEFTNEHFENLTNLRFLKIKKANLVGDFKNSLSELRWLELKGSPSYAREDTICQHEDFMATFHPNLRFRKIKMANLVGDFKNSLSELSWLKLKGSPSYAREDTICQHEDFMATFHPKKLVVLKLSYCKLEHWKGWGQIQLARRLKVLRLSNCDNTTTPDFSALRELEILDLSGCESLRNIDASIHNLNKTLKILNVCGCLKLEKLPIGVGEMEELRELLIDGIGIREIPIFEGFMTKLEKLSANNCKELVRIPDSIGSLEMLRSLSLEGCISLTKIPETIGKLKSLTELCLTGTDVTNLPDSFRDLRSLKFLGINNSILHIQSITVNPSLRT